MEMNSPWQFVFLFAFVVSDSSAQTRIYGANVTSRWDIEKKHDAERRHQSVYRLLAAFSGLGSLLDVVKDAVDDGVEVVVDLVVVVEDDLGVDLDLESSHDGSPSFFLAATAARSPSGGQGYVRFSISHETRSQSPKRNIIIPLFTNQDLISCLHLLVNDTLSDKEFSLNSSTKADIYIISEC